VSLNLIDKITSYKIKDLQTHCLKIFY